jgi:hypothetical protein
MTAARVPTIALLVFLGMMASQVSADPITDPGSVNTGGPYDTSLVDGSGLPFLLTGLPTYLLMTNNDSNGGGAGGGEETGGPGGTTAGDDPLSSLFSGPSGPTDTGLFTDFNDGPDSGDDTNNIFEFFDFESFDLGDGPQEDWPNDVPGILNDSQETRAVPEPAVMLMIGAGLTAALRRRARTNGTV